MELYHHAHDEREKHFRKLSRRNCDVSEQSRKYWAIIFAIFHMNDLSQALKDAETLKQSLLRGSFSFISCPSLVVTTT